MHDMKKNFLMTAVLGAALLAACQPVEPEKTEQFGTLSVNLAAPATMTKSDTSPLSCESKVNRMRVMIYNSAGNIVRDTLLSSPYNSLSISQIKVGQYSVYAVANSCSSIPSSPGIITNPNDFSNKMISLSDCNLDENTGFVMFGSNPSVTVTTSATPQPADLSVTRFPARIRLVSVTNALPDYLGDLTVERVMIVNGYAQWNIAGNSNPTIYVNPAGRNATSGNIISSAEEADYPAHSFWALPLAEKNIVHGATKTYNHSFYSFPNAVANDVTTAGTGGGKLRLVAAIRVDQTLYYYPVTLTNVERNKSYDVKLTVSGLGSEDPNHPVEKGAAGISISVSGWGDGAEYTETI